MKFFATLCLALIAFLPSSFAQQNANGMTINPGETVVTLSATEQTELKQDTLQASLRIEVEAKTAKDVQDQINKAMKSALELAKANKDLKVSTGQYYVYSYDPNPQPRTASEIKNPSKRVMLWKGNQTIDLESKNQASILDTVGKIQDMGFAMNGLNYTLSMEQQEIFRDTLMSQALQKIQKRAELISKTLNKSSYDIMEVNVDGGYMQPVPVMMRASKMEMAVASDAMAPPVAEAGQQNISLTVTARVLLRK